MFFIRILLWLFCYIIMAQTTFSLIQSNYDYYRPGVGAEYSYVVGAVSVLLAIVGAFLIVWTAAKRNKNSIVLHKIKWDFTNSGRAGLYSLLVVIILSSFFDVLPFWTMLWGRNYWIFLIVYISFCLTSAFAVRQFKPVLLSLTNDMLNIYSWPDLKKRNLSNLIRVQLSNGGNELIFRFDEGMNDIEINLIEVQIAELKELLIKIQERKPEAVSGQILNWFDAYQKLLETEK
jgi:hypothetical protein